MLLNIENIPYRTFLDVVHEYDNPNDDKNMLVAQVLFYPLNANFISNLDFIIEQLP